ncbi:DUF3883 domain-containing protein [Stigmatella sp. ncwal1]|uniref:DUF3883 domain-containing protein n=1 Tax=Stigmatella ashevillensis TaxID=2995309 RepID=A0ABT5D504_9BACT|nr:DUF3883 domain-containing protein [Stigmatella ashevillena]MDC0708745.1 DUF3883 domain-containing protein [Stigmatella ashevillena]
MANKKTRGDTSQPQDPVESIREKTIGEIRTFIAELGNGTAQYRTVHSLTQQIEHQYHSRFIIELLQNAHDALLADPSVGKGRIEVALVTESSGASSIYVANDGRPFQPENFLAIARLGQSNKDPTQSVGHKGLGFRSVLEVCDAPEIYSRAPTAPDLGSGVACFDGYCFRFAPSIVAAIGEAALELLEGGTEARVRLDGIELATGPVDAERYRARIHASGTDPMKEAQLLSAYLLPLPVTAQPPHVADYAARGFSTVVRLSLRDEAARRNALERLAEIDEETFLFLHALSHLDLRVPGEASRSYRKFTVAPPPEGFERQIRIVRDGVEGEAVFRLWERTVGGENAEEAAELQVAVKGLSESWKKLTEVSLAVAVRLDQPTEGLFFIHLPTKLPTGVAAHLHAPFYGDLSRKNIDWTNPLNALLLRYVIKWIDQLVRQHLAGGGLQDALAIIDLLAPLQGSTNAIQSIIPGLKDTALLLTDKGWKTPAQARLIPQPANRRLLDASRLRRHAAFAALPQDLESRRPALTLLFRQLQLDDKPTYQELAETLQGVARDLHARLRKAPEEGASEWVTFWQETEQLIPRDHARFLRDQSLLLSHDGELLTSSSSRHGPKIFFQPSRGEEDEPLEAGGLSRIQVPPTLSASIAFLSDSIPLLQTVTAGRREKTAVRRYLEGTLVDEYGALPILRDVVIPSLPRGRVIEGSPEADRCREALDFGLRIIRGASGQTSLLPLLSQLRVPCKGGWFVASDTAFGPGWEHRGGEALLALLDETHTEHAGFERDRLLLPPDHPNWSGHGPGLAKWLDQAGTTRGLRLRPFKEDWSSLCRSAYCRFQTLPEHPPPGVAAAQWQAYRHAIRETTSTHYSGWFTYEWKDQRRIAALDRFDSLSRAGRSALMQVLLHSLSCWPPEWSSASLHKLEGNPHRITTPSFLRHTLAELEWIWLDEESKGARPRSRWFVPQVIDRRQARQFEHLRPAPASVVKATAEMLQSPLDQLILLGMPRLDFDQKSPSPRLLDDLADGAAEQRFDPVHRPMFLAQARDAWGAFEPGNPPQFPRRFIVMRGSHGPLAMEPTPEDPLYIPDGTQRGIERTLPAGIPILLIAPKDASRLLSTLQRVLGDRVRTLSALKLEPFRGDIAWQASPTVERLDQSALRWLAPFALTVSAFAGGQYGTQTKTFAQAQALLRAVRIEPVEQLAVRVAKLGDGSAVPTKALWHAESTTLLYDPTSDEWLEALAGPLQQILDRHDLEAHLRLTLGRLGNAREPDMAAQHRALATINITRTQYEEVRQRWFNNLQWLVERLRPVMALLRPDFNVGLLASLGSVEAAQDCIGPWVGQNPAAAWLIEQASEGDDRAMGRALWERLGTRAELQAWNAALRASGPEYRELENSEWLAQLRSHRAAAMIPLLSIARWIAAREKQPSDYVRISEALQKDPEAAHLARSYWEVPFHATLRELRGAFVGIQGADAALAVIDAATDIDMLCSSIERDLEGAEPRVDPSGLLRDNLDRCGQLLGQLQMSAVAWRGKMKQPVGPWAQAADSLLEHVRVKLRRGDGYLSRFDDAEALRRLRESLENVVPDPSFWSLIEGCSSSVDVRARLGVTAEDEARALVPIASAQQDAQRRARLARVCGGEYDPDAPSLGSQLWTDLSKKFTQDELGALATSLVGANLEVLQRAGRKRETKGNGGGSGGSRKGLQMSDGLKRVVGLIGEILAFRILEKRFGETAVGRNAWCSKNSSLVFSDNEGDDSLGYDFQVVSDRYTWHIEVKASLDTSEQFELGSSEVRKALELANKRRQRYRILHICNLNGEPEVRFLPNPYDQNQRDRFIIDEAGMRVRYREVRDEENSD